MSRLISELSNLEIQILNSKESDVFHRNQVLDQSQVFPDERNQGIRILREMREELKRELGEEIPQEVIDHKGICPGYNLPVDRQSFGVEIECYSPRPCDDMGINREGEGIDFLPSHKGNKWISKRDGSLPYDVGVEFISPVLHGIEGLKNVMDSMDYLRSKGFHINSNNCGLHIHVGLKGIVGNNNIDEVCSFLSRLSMSVFNYQFPLFGSCGMRRERNSHVIPLEIGERLIDQMMIVGRKGKGNKNENDFSRCHRYSNKFRPLNLSKLNGGVNGSSSTIEFRYPGGSLSPLKFMMYIIQIMWLIRQSWVDRHDRKGSDSISWELKKGFQKFENRRNVGKMGFKYLSRKIKNSIRGKWLKWEMKELNENWDSIFSEWERLSKKYDQKFNL